MDQTRGARWLYTAEAEDSGARGWYTYTTTFDLAGYDYTLASLSFKCALDQYGSVYLNGDLVTTYGDGNWSNNLNSITISTGFLSGGNTLTFRVYFPDGGDGLVVSESNLAAPLLATPEPCTMLLFGFGLAGLAVFRKRRIAA